jgi:DNA-binding beta-propeller fold protein YncE
MISFRSAPILFALAAIGISAAAAGDPAKPMPAVSTLPMPAFRFETNWLKLPVDLVMGEVVAVAVDARDHVWVLHRPRTVKDHPASQVAPPITEFDPAGQYLRGFGGPGEGYEWPTNEHTLALAANGNIWISGNNRDADHGDDMLLVFDRQGHFVRQIGQRGATRGNFDYGNFHAPADIYLDNRANDAYIADGYGNQRLIVLDERTGRFRRMWGAFGKLPPPVAPPAPTGASTGDGPETFYGVHGVEKSRDGLIYVSDRANQRIQVFTPTGKYRGQVFIDRELSAPLTASGITFSRDRRQRYLFVADWGNGKIVVVDRLALQVIGTIGQTGTAPGEFKGPHLIDTDSKGVIYVAEVQGRRLQRLIPAGTGLAPR